MGVPNGYTSAQVVQAVPTGINSALVCVKAETAFSAVSSITADNIFTSSYTNYLLLIEFANTDNATLNIQYRASGSTTATNYNFNNIQAATAVSTSSYQTSQTSASFCQSGGSSLTSFSQLNIFAPQQAKQTGMISHNMRFDGAYTTPIYQGFIGIQNSSTQFDGFIISTSVGTTTGNYAVYGYAKTV